MHLLLLELFDLPADSSTFVLLSLTPALKGLSYCETMNAGALGVCAISFLPISSELEGTLLPGTRLFSRHVEIGLCQIERPLTT